VAEPERAAVTFLLTDLESSVSLREEHPEAMRSGLAEHDRIVRGLIGGHGGTIFKGTGDGFWAVFDLPRAALEAAIAIHEAIRLQSWGELGALQIRIALHSGDAEYRDGDYFGPTLNRAARLLSATESGETLLSDTVADALRDHLPAQVSLVGLGDLRLRGLREPLRVYRALGSDMPRATPSTGIARPDYPSPANAGSGGRELRGTLRVYTLGTFRVERDGAKIDDQHWTRRKARQLFKCLITRSTRRLAKDEAFELFWPESDPEAAAKTLRSTVHALRQTLAGGRRSEGADWIVVDADGVAVRRDPDVWVDADAFEQLVSRARGAANADERLEEADRLYAGEYLPDDLYEDWASRRRESLRREWSDLQLALARVREQRMAIDGAVLALERLVRADPCDERAVRELMGLLARNGRRADALRSYQQLVAALRDELGVEPAAETRELNQRIADGQLDGQSVAGSRSTAPSPAPEAAEVTATPARPEPMAPDAPPTTPVRAFAPTYPFPTPSLLIGRQRELLTLERLIDPSRSACHTVFLGAAAGTGKSTLVGALVRRASERGVLCLVGGSFDQRHGLPFGPVRDALADFLLDQPATRLRADLGEIATDLAEIVPELRYHLGLSGSTPGRSMDAGRLFAAVHACLCLLAGERPVLLCLEDLHAADDATLALLHYLARPPRRAPIAVVGTYRADEVEPGHPLDRLVLTLGRERLAERVELAPFRQDEAASFVMALLDGPASDSLSASLFAVTEGNPLFLEQLTLALREEGHVDQRDGVWYRIDDDQTTLTPIIRDVIGRRFSRLSGRCRETLALAATFGQTFEHRALVVGLEGAEARAVEDIDEAISTQLVYETAHGYRFGHAMVRESLYQSLSGPKRRQLHATAAAALETVSGAVVEERASELAHHYLRAGAETAMQAKALRFSLAAGRRATALAAHREALDHFSRACELAHRGADGDPDTRLDALNGRGQALLRLGQWNDCIRELRELCDVTGQPHRRAWARVAISRALSQLGDSEAVLEEIEIGLSECGDPAPPETVEARLWLRYNQAFIWYLRGRYRDLYDLGNEILAVGTQLGLASALAAAHNVLAWSWMGQGRVDEALREYELAQDVALRANDKNSLAVAEENLGIQCYRGAHFARARVHLERAVELYRELAGNRRNVNCIQTLARVSIAEGDPQSAIRYAEEALAAAVDGHDRWVADCQDVLGTAYAVLGEDDRAIPVFEQALAVRERVGHAAGQVESLLGLGMVAERRGENQRARACFQRAIEIAEAMDLCPQVVAARRALGLLLVSASDARGDELLIQALETVETMPESIEAAPTYVAVARARLMTAPDDALELALRALAARPTTQVCVEAHAIAARAAHALLRHDVAREHRDACFDRAHVTASSRLVEFAEQVLQDVRSWT
jgi:DNA-binding SARP family transcriptional activator/predicted ATPase/class 3 adenylate cyclase